MPRDSTNRIGIMGNTDTDSPNHAAQDRSPNGRTLQQHPPPTQSVSLPVPEDMVLQALLCSTMALVALVDADGHAIYVNPAFEALTGYSLDELRDRPIWMLRPADQRQDGYQSFFTREAIQEGRRFETTWVAKDGSTHHLLCATQPLAIEGREAGCRVATAIDVTELRLAERHSRSLAEMLDQITEALVQVDSDLTIAWCNSAAEALYGYPRAELQGQPNTIFVPAGLAEEREEFVDELFASRETRARQTLRRRKDGAVVPVEVRVTPILAETGQVDGFLSLSHDTSEEQRLRSERAEVEARVAQLAEIVETLVDPVLRCDENGTLMYVNAATCELTGKAATALLGAPIHQCLGDTFALDTLMQDCTRRHCDRAAFETTLRAIKDPHLPVELRVTPQWSAEGKFVGCVVIAYDLTTQKRREADLERLARTDALTGLANRRGLDSSVDLELMRAER